MISTGDFQPVTLSSRDELVPRISRSGVKSCEFSFANLVMWGKTFDIRYAVYRDHLYLMELDDDGKKRGLLFLPDAGNEPDATELREVSGALKSADNPGVFYCVPQEYLDRHCDLDDFFTVSPMGEDYDDYLYEVDSLAGLRGEKLAKKRNLIRQFLRDHPGAEVREITSSMVGECLALAEIWRSTHPDGDSPEMLQEKAALGTLAENFDELDFTGAAVYHQGEMIAFELCSPLSDGIYDEHFEKSLYFAKGAAQFVNRECAKLLQDKAKYLNREQDMGLAGLRQAKRSYMPCEMVKNFAITPR